MRPPAAPSEDRSRRGFLRAAGTGVAAVAAAGLASGLVRPATVHAAERSRTSPWTDPAVVLIPSRSR